MLTLLQGCVKKHFPPTVDQPSYYKSPMPPVFFASVLNQRRHLTSQYFELSETDRPNPSTRTNGVILKLTFCPFQNKQICL